ncbi:MAG: GTPase ObgE [Planctomycetota bacterium]|nr:GTPase ObgE [Planctomycetota bacterium]
MFVDCVTIRVKAGDGGDGCVAFLREKFRPWGGPAGGDGGRGGDVIFEASREADTLLHLYRRKLIKARSGAPGQGKNCAGRDGESAVVRVPVGTIVKDALTGGVLCDLAREGMRFIAARGGRGGRGNRHFATPSHRTPREFEGGEKGEERMLTLELKLIADVGLIGLPNAGKSTLLARISAARPRIAPFPFTTLCPQLGIVEIGDFRRLIVADLPGIIEGAHEGAGLGDEFLRHIERTAFLLHVVDICPPDGSDPAENFRIVEREVERYSPELASRGRIVAANKIDLPGGERAARRLARRLPRLEVIPISAATGKGIGELVSRLAERVGTGRLSRSAW